MIALHRSIYFLLLLLLGTSSGWAQTRPFEEDNIDYTKEWTMGILFTSQGGTIGGVSLRHARKYTARYKVEESLGINSGKVKTSNMIAGKIERKGMYHSFSLDILNIKHAKEDSYGTVEGSSYVRGKRNYFWIVRPTYGREFILFRKAREKGVQVSLLASAGPAIGLVAPYMVRVYDENTRVVSIEQHDRNKHRVGGPLQVLGTASLNKSLSDMSARLGLGMKASLAFDFGLSNRSISGLEGGLMLDAFPDRVPIMDGPPNERIFPSIFMNFYFGARK